MDNNKTPEALDCSYTNLCCYSPVIPFTGFGVVGVTWAEAASTATETLDAPMFPQYSNLIELFTDRRIEKSRWVCDYSDDIFQTLRETELRRNVLSFQSEQCGFRPAMLRLLKVATEVHKLSRTTLHLALYLLDGFMDSYTIRTEKLNLTAITCLIIAAKIEEADINAPKFTELNKLVGDVYTMDDFRKAEMKILMLFHFDLIRPTVATFAEYFANNIITLDDFHLYLQNWHGGIFDFRTIPQHQQMHNATTAGIVLPYYRTYEEMATALSKLLFNLVDETLSYVKFVNARPSIIAASCIAAVRHLSFVTPLWTPYLVSVTECSQDMIEPSMEAIIALHNLHLSKVQAMLYAAAKLSNAGATLCDSPESGFVSLSDMKSESSDNESDHDDKFSCRECPVVLGKRSRSATCSDESDEEQNNTASLNPDYPLLGKRRRILENNDLV